MRASVTYWAYTDREYFDEIFGEQGPEKKIPKEKPTISINLADGSSLILELNKINNEEEDSKPQYYVFLDPNTIKTLIEKKKSASDIVEAIKTQLVNFI